MPKQFPISGMAFKTHFDFEATVSGYDGSPSDIADIVVHRTYTNAKLESKSFSFIVYSDTGKPHDPVVWLNKRGKKQFADILEHFEPVPDRSCAYRCIAKFSGPAGQFNTIVTRYRWKHAGLLSRDSIKKELKKPAQVYSRVLYEQFLEHVFVRCPDTTPPSAIDLSATIPREWAPDDDGRQNVKAYVQASGEEEPQHDSRLTEIIFDNGEGHFSLSIRDPTPGARYYLAWCVRQYCRKNSV